MGLEQARCPECGLAFDLSDQSTFSKHPRSALREWLRSWPSAVVVVFVGMWWLHVLVTGLGGPLDDLLDPALYILAIGLKLAAIVAVLYLLHHTYRSIEGNAKDALIAFGCWASVGLAFVIVLAIARPLLSAILSTDTARYYQVANVSASEIGSIEWLPRWQRGEVFAVEAALVIVLAATHALIGWSRMEPPRAKLPIGVVATIGLLIAHTAVFDLWTMDYDNFHGDIFSGGLLLDLVIPLPSDPYTSIGSVFFGGFCIACWMFDHFCRSRNAIRSASDLPTASERTPNSSGG